MDRKTGFLLFSAILVLLPIIGGAYLYYLVENINLQYESDYSAEEIIEQIESSENLETLKKAALYIYMLQMKVISFQQAYVIRLAHIVIVIGILNGMLACIFYRKYIIKDN